MRIFNGKDNKTQIPAEEVRPFVTAILVAAGNSTRMGGVNKQFLLIDGAPVLSRTVRAFADSPWIDEIIIAAREQDIADIYAMVRDYDLPKVTEIVKGGATRQESVFSAIRHCAQNAAYIAIHDGARPLVTSQVIGGTVEAALAHGAAATGVRVKDTIKVVDVQQRIVDTLNRSTLWAVQTPQVFHKESYLRAAKAVQGSEDFTDDCKLFEAAGLPVYMVEGSYENIKITTREDVILAESILAGRDA